MKKTSVPLAQCLVMLLSPLAHSMMAGGESSAGGADDYRVQPAFFLAWSDPMRLVPVKACYQVAPGFGIENSVLEAMIRSGFKQWGDYVLSKKIGAIAHARIPIRTELDLSTHCDDKTEMTFYFGVENDQIKQFRSQFEHPFGFAQLISEEDPKGMVWIAPPRSISQSEDETPNLPVWSSDTEGALAALLLHEIGHVFGNQHVDGTVMSSQIGWYLENDTDLTKKESDLALYSRIDVQRDLYVCTDCEEVYQAASSFDLISHSDSDWEYTFKRVVGKDAVLPILSIQLVRDPSDSASSESQYRYPGSGTLILIDGSGTYRVPVDVETMDAGTFDSPHLFQGVGGEFLQSAFYTYYGKIRALRGPAIPVSVSYNTHGVRAEIVPLEEGFPRPLFSASSIRSQFR